MAISEGAHIVVGATRETFTSTNGAAYVFTCPIASTDPACYTQFRYLSSSIKSAGVIGSSTLSFGDQYGVSVAIDGDPVIAGANSEDRASAADESDNSAVDSGAAYARK